MRVLIVKCPFCGREFGYLVSGSAGSIEEALNDLLKSRILNDLKVHLAQCADRVYLYKELEEYVTRSAVLVEG